MPSFYYYKCSITKTRVHYPLPLLKKQDFVHPSHPTTGASHSTSLNADNTPLLNDLALLLKENDRLKHQLKILESTTLNFGKTTSGASNIKKQLDYLVEKYFYQYNENVSYSLSLLLLFFLLIHRGGCRFKTVNFVGYMTI